jgi:Domain of unknown function (DUF4214)/Matrixin
VAGFAVLASLAAPIGASVASTAAAAGSGTQAADTVYDGSRDGFDGTVYRLYRAFFLREPDGDGIVYWINQARYGRYPIGSIAEEFARSPEFRQRYGTLTEGAFVDLVYRNVLGRAAEADGRAYWLGQLRSGMPRGHLMLYFSDSVEFGRKVGAGPFGREDHRGPARPAPDAPAGSYRYLTGDPATPEQPLTWPRCRPVYVVANPAGIPTAEHARFEAMLEHALDEVSEATDQDWVHVGSTAHRAADSNTTREVLGTVTVSFMTAPDPSDRASAWAVAQPGRDPLTGAVHYVTGVVNLNAQRLVGDHGGRVTPLVATTLMHELGHIAGLDHVDDPAQLMHGYYSLSQEPTYEDYRDGDLAGLARVGSTTTAC